MKRMMVVLGLAMMLVTGMWAQGAGKKSAAKAGAKSGGSVDQMLMDMEKKWAEGGKKADASMVEPILADNFMSMNADGRYLSKKEYLDEMSKSKWETNEVSNMKVNAHGTHAVVTGDWHGKGTDGSGKSVDQSEHWMDTFIKMPNGKWQAVASASTNAKK